MAHKLAVALQDTMRVGNLSATKEPDVDVTFEHIDVAEGRIGYTRRWMTVVQELSHILSAGTHDLEPAPRERPQLTGVFVHPHLDRWISLNRTWKPHKSGSTLKLVRFPNSLAATHLDFIFYVAHHIHSILISPL
jgi:hypothetical protein